MRLPDGVLRRSIALYYYTASRAIYNETPNTDTIRTPGAKVNQPPPSHRGSTNGHALAAGVASSISSRRRSSPARPAAPAILIPDRSAALRERLIAELDVLQSADEAARWAQRSLPAKNTLTASDAQRVEARFGAKVVTFGDQDPAERQLDGGQSHGGTPPENEAHRAKTRSTPYATISIAVRSQKRSTPSAKQTAGCFAMRIWRRSG